MPGSAGYVRGRMLGTVRAAAADAISGSYTYRSASNVTAYVLDISSTTTASPRTKTVTGCSGTASVASSGVTYTLKAGRKADIA